jgi:putative tricarboxylic transport membrane protein
VPPGSTAPRGKPAWAQLLVGAGVLAVAGGLAWGARAIPSAAGYAGVGPDFLPWVVAAALALLGLWLLAEAATGGLRSLPAPSGAARGDWGSLAWVVAGVLANAALIERMGFVFACALCFALAARGLRRSEGQGGAALRRGALDLAIGIVIAAPVYWLFSKLLGVNLPGLTGTGWV